MIFFHTRTAEKTLASFSQGEETMKVIKLLALCIVVLSFFACTHSVQPPADPIQANLNKNMALWQNSNLSTYTYTYKRVCFCPPEEDILVTVTNGQVSAASYSPSGIALPLERVNQFMSVEELFQVIQKAITDQVAKLDVTYNSASGYPESIYIDIDERMADEERTHLVSNLH